MTPPSTDELRIAGIVLAAGASTRLGQAKQLLKYQGKTLLARTISALQAAECAPLVVVIGAREAEIRDTLDALPYRASLQVIHHPGWAEGMGSSIAAGAQALPEVLHGVVLSVCDQPALDAAVLRRLRAEINGDPAQILVSAYGTSHGPPVYFGANYLPELAQLSGQAGAKSILLRYAEQVINIPFPDGAWDVDTPADCARLKSTV